MHFDVDERGLVRLGHCTTEVIFVTTTGSWAVNMPGSSSGAVGVARRHIVTIRSLDDPALVICVPVDDHAVSDTIGKLGALGSTSHSLTAVRQACASVFASLAPLIAFVEFGCEATAYVPVGASHLLAGSA